MNSREIISLGISNQTTKVDKMHFRIIDLDTPNPHRFDFEFEVEMAANKLTVPLLKLDLESGMKVTQTIDDARPVNECQFDEKKLHQFLTVLDSFHSLTFPTPIYFSPFITIKEFSSKLKEDPLMKEKELLQEFEELYKNAPEDSFILSHNDLSPGNILFSPHRCYLIDFEFASYNLPFFDYFSLLSEGVKLTNKMRTIILSSLDKKYPTSLRLSDDKCYAFLDLYWYYWAKVSYLQTKRPVFLKIAEDKKTSYLFLINRIF